MKPPVLNPIDTLSLQANPAGQPVHSHREWKLTDEWHILPSALQREIISRSDAVQLGAETVTLEDFEAWAIETFPEDAQL